MTGLPMPQRDCSTRRRKPARGVITAMLVFACLAALPGQASAGGYGFDPSIPRDERPGNIYFGSAKDTNGDFVAGVTIVLETKAVDYVAVTDVTGRFRLEVADELQPTDVVSRCSRRGYLPGRIVKRLPPGGAKTPVQLDCVIGR